MGATGTATINFGSFPGKSLTSVAVADTNIVSGSKVEAWFQAGDTTADHTENDHLYARNLVALSAGDINQGTGFTIYGTCLDLMQGTFAVRWVWV